jgi:ribose transport system ATP-binding protein
MRNIRKTFPGVVALDDVSFKVKKGEIHALVGENGAGKSTLMKVLNGVHQADRGEILLDGEVVTIKGTTDAEKKGIGLVFQECNLINPLTVSENMFLNKLGQGKKGFIKWKELNKITQDFLDKFKFRFKATEKIEDLSASQKQMVEIAKVLYKKPRILVMDEPTSSLTVGETEHLFSIMNELKAEGITIIYISHKMDEIFSMCDTATVLRDGQVIETRATKDFTRDEIVERMVGRSVDVDYPHRNVELGEVVLKGLNRHTFEDKLLANLRRRLKNNGNFNIYSKQSTIYVEPLNDECDIDAAYDTCQKSFGIVALVRAKA